MAMTQTGWTRSSAMGSDLCSFGAVVGAAALAPGATLPGGPNLTKTANLLAVGAEDAQAACNLHENFRPWLALSMLRGSASSTQ